MNTQKIVRFVKLLASVFLGGMLLYGGVGKFTKPIPTPVEVVQKAEKFQQPDKIVTLQKILYINGMKQTGYLWQFLAIMQIICGLLLISQVFRLLGAIMAFPIVINIFLFHVFLEFDEKGELLLTLGLLLIDVWLILSSYKILKPMLYQKINLRF